MATGSIVANPSPPAAPSGLTASQSGTLVVLTWQDNSSNETVFYIERCQGVGCTNFGSFVATQWPNVPSYTDYSAVTGQSYSYRVRAYNSGGYSAYSNIASILVGAANQPPTAVISALPTTGVAPLSVAFDGSRSTDIDGTIAAWAWSFGDGSSGSGPMITHVYSAAGFYVANVTVTDNGGASNTTSVTINATAGASSVPTAPTNLVASSSTRSQDQPHVDQHGRQRDVDHGTALQRELVHGLCRRRPARRDGEVLDRHGGEVAIDVSLSGVRVQRRGEIAVLEHRERDGALSTSVVYASPCRCRAVQCVR